MGRITDPITYNVRDRGRKHLGKDRNLDTAALAALINGPAVQERVKHGDMLGFFGHWPRIKFGMDPVEGGIVDGVVISVPHAIRTVELSAQPDGTITHRAEFLPTKEGEIAATLYDACVGGFSSAIDVLPGSMPQIANGFYGFDYVAAQGGPNYTTNRGHRVVLDGVAGEAAVEDFALLDAVMSDTLQSTLEMHNLFAALQAQHSLAMQTIERVARENDELVALLARGGGTGLLDGLMNADRVAPIRGGRSPADFKRFLAMPLEETQKLDDAAPATETPESLYARRRFGV